MRMSLAVRPPLIALLVLVAMVTPWIVGNNYGIPSQMVVGIHPTTWPYFFPNGGRTLFPRYRLVALYGAPDTPVLGALGEQDMLATITRVKTLANIYQPLMAEYALPALEIIATVASDSPTEDGDYSSPTDVATLTAWITAARKQGAYVVLDVQPGRSSFITQVQRLQAQLEQPNVGLALDPEWRLKAGQLPLKQIGSVDISEVNSTLQWLAGLTKTHQLPQKLFLLHQFRLDMLPGREQLDTSHAELAYVIQMDGQGTQPAKESTWQSITASPPARVQFGWKNFYQKDSPIRSPEDTMKLAPEPWYISYQ